MINDPLTVYGWLIGFGVVVTVIRLITTPNRTASTYLQRYDPDEWYLEDIVKALEADRLALARKLDDFSRARAIGEGTAYAIGLTLGMLIFFMLHTV